MNAPRHTDDAIVAGIHAATRAWCAPQDTAYYAERFGYDIDVMSKRLHALEAAGRLTHTQHRVWGGLIVLWKAGDNHER
jgi:hypothetical protein